MGGESGERQRREDRRTLLDWASNVSGLPLQHISEVQNGAVFCYIISLVCELDLSLVNHDAQEECECLANYRLLQTVAKARRMRGLNHTAKLSHWGRLAVHEADAWEFLGVLRRCLTRAGKGDTCTEIEADATAPPPPLSSRKGRKKRLASQLSMSPSYASHRPDTARAKTSTAISADIDTLVDALSSSNLSDTEPFIPASIKTRPGGGDDARDAVTDSFSPRLPTPSYYERNHSGASTISARGSTAPSPSGWLSERERYKFTTRSTAPPSSLAAHFL